MSERAQALEAALDLLTRKKVEQYRVAGWQDLADAVWGYWHDTVREVLRGQPESLAAPPVGVSPQPDEYRERMRLHDLVLEVIAAWQESDNYQDDGQRRGMNAKQRSALRARLKLPASLSPVEPTPLSERHLPPAVVMLVSAA